MDSQTPSVPHVSSGEKAELENARPEHPRPDAVRPHWLNLNGAWDFAFDAKNLGEQERWYRPQPGQEFYPLSITVPFPWESHLSGVCAPDYRGAGWYRRKIAIPADWPEQGLHPILRFEAVDWNAKVWINGWFAGEHDGGYSPFEIDLAPFLAKGRSNRIDPEAKPGEVTIIVRAWDVCAADTPLGKQVKEWYTPSSGIWQAVWLEGRRPCYVKQVHFSPDLADAECRAWVTIEVDEPGEYEFEIRSRTSAFAPVRASVTAPLGVSSHDLEIPLPDARLWSPQDPYLYEVTASLECRGEIRDALQTYFGMREVRRGTWGGSDFEYVLLNGEPVYLRGVLDQAFHPDGLHTYPSDDAIKADVEAARDAGFNLLRCHIKINDPRYYYWADRLGLLVMSDIPSPKIYTARSRVNWEQTFRDAVARDFNHPSIVAWILFNETWGLEEHQTEAGWTWIKQMYQLCRGLDPTRLAEDNSACLYDHVATDLNSWHFYINSYDRARRHINRVVTSTSPGSPFNYVGGGYLQGSEPLLNSEYGGIGASDGDRDVSYSMKYLTAELRRHEKVVGYVYTELTDIEWEHNGILNYDRTAKEWGYDAFAPGMEAAGVHSEDFLGADAPPCQTVKPGAVLQIPLFFSQFSRQELDRVEVRWSASFCNRLAEDRIHQEGRHSFGPARCRVVPAGTIELTVPGEPGLVTVSMEAAGPGGMVLARHYLQVEVIDSRTSEFSSTEERAVDRAGSDWLLCWNPGDYSESEWADASVSRKGWKFSARSYGSVEYELMLPEDLDTAGVKGMRLRFEAGARTANRRIEWLAKRGHLNYPQTEVDRKYGSNLEVQLNGVTVGQVHLPDDPADARGVLSHHNEVDPGSYGFLVDLPVDAEQARAILQRAAGGTLNVRLAIPKTAKDKGGLSLYGRRVGRYPLDPTLVIQG